MEKRLAEALDRHFSKTDGKTPPNLQESIRYSLLAPGKRIRPRILMACAEMLELPQEVALPSALALEMIHCFTLIHDDLPCMDNDDFRRGRPSNHKVFGEGIALLAGDALIALAWDVFLQVGKDAGKSVPASYLLEGVKRLNWAMGPRGVIGGQAAESLLHPGSSIEELRQMHAQKTGALFSAALLIPMDLAGIQEESQEGRLIRDFASELGLAFQVADDLEDAASDVGKPTSILFFLSPEEARKQTLQGLQRTAEGLRSHWGEKARPVLKIAQEVSGKLA